MLQPKRIHVTLDDIEDGKPYDAAHCPIALALQRAYPNVDFYVGPEAVSVHILHSLITDEQPLPPRLINWIGAYDSKYHVQPITFTFPFEETPCPRSPNP